MARPKRPTPVVVPKTIDLWPDAGMRLKFSRDFTYAMAAKGEIRGAKKIGGKWIVFLEPFNRWLEEGD
jgi:hypothetical protein